METQEFHEELRLTQQVVEAVARRQLVWPEAAVLDWIPPELSWRMIEGKRFLTTPSLFGRRFVCQSVAVVTLRGSTLGMVLPVSWSVWSRASIGFLWFPIFIGSYVLWKDHYCLGMGHTWSSCHTI